ncbi:hypothetical protein AXF42_Ash021026 [Apostasia shenzhenica]|uniref:Uncharacterized protein n=1 Tax=Apostasia shenzhenica TaxID=1088818 RepID=A0A2I0ADW0_9ASPA|nr:hypothetical protein AXF42_Ash021026 [Apostasia shenzhenica]
MPTLSTHLLFLIGKNRTRTQGDSNSTSSKKTENWQLFDKQNTSEGSKSTTTNTSTGDHSNKETWS